MFLIDVPDINDSLVEVELDEEVFILHFSWNDTVGYWSLSIQNVYNDELISCLPIYPNRRLLEFVKNAQLPLGDFIVIRNDDTASIGRADFSNGSAALMYIGVDDEYSVFAQLSVADREKRRNERCEHRPTNQNVV